MTEAPRICAIVQARMTSTRLPGKVLMMAAGKPMLEHLVERVRRAPPLDGIIIATTVNDSDDAVVRLANDLSVGYYRGSEEDVLTRVLEAAKAYDVDIIVELTGDNPLIDPAMIVDCIRLYMDSDVDYASNILEPGLPHGFPVQVFSTKVLADVARRTDDPIDHEHVSLFIYRNPDIYRTMAMPVPSDLHRPEVQLTLDEPDDYRLISSVFEALYANNPEFTIRDVLAYLDSNPELLEINRHVRRKSV